MYTLLRAAEELVLLEAVLLDIGVWLPYSVPHKSMVSQFVLFFLIR